MKCSVNIRINPKKVYPTTLKQLALELRVEPGDLDEVLDDWSHAQIVTHLSQFPANVLNSLPQERRFRNYLDEKDERQS